MVSLASMGIRLGVVQGCLLGCSDLEFVVQGWLSLWSCDLGFGG